MNLDIFVIIICVISLILGALIGIQLFRIYNNKINKKLLKNAKEVLEGKRKNIITIDGCEYDATKFITKDKNGNNILTDLKGGDIVEYGTKEKEINKEEYIGEEIGNSQHPGENRKSNGEKCGSSREEKRTSRRRSIISRIRRFG